MSKNQRRGIVIGSHTGGTINVEGDSSGEVVVSGKQSGGVVIAGPINTAGGTYIASSTGTVHHGSGNQVNIRSGKKGNQ